MPQRAENPVNAVNSEREVAPVGGATSASRAQQTVGGREQKVNTHTWYLVLAAAIACVPVAMAWFQSTEFSAGWSRTTIAVLGFFLGTVAGLAFSLVGSSASVIAWKLTARIADQQDEVMASVHGDVNKHGEKVGRLEAAVEKLEKNLKVQTDEIQRGREAIRTERRVRSYFRIRSLPSNQVNEIDMFRLEVEMKKYGVSFTPITEDYCVGVLEKFLSSYGQRSADIQFRVRPRPYSSKHSLQSHDVNASETSQVSKTETGDNSDTSIAIYFDLAECCKMEEIPEDALPMRLQRREGEPAVVICQGFQGTRDEPITDEPPSYKSVIARFRRGSRHVFIVAGLSQPGTRAAGDFLENLFKEEARNAVELLHINPRVYEILSGVAQDQDPDGQPAGRDFFCVVKATVRDDPDYAVMGLQVDALYYSDEGVSWRRDF